MIAPVINQNEHTIFRRYGFRTFVDLTLEMMEAFSTGPILIAQKPRILYFRGFQRLYKQ